MGQRSDWRMLCTPLFSTEMALEDTPSRRFLLGYIGIQRFSDSAILGKIGPEGVEVLVRPWEKVSHTLWYKLSRGGCPGCLCVWKLYLLLFTTRSWIHHKCIRWGNDLKHKVPVTGNMNKYPTESLLSNKSHPHNHNNNIFSALFIKPSATSSE